MASLNSFILFSILCFSIYAGAAVNAVIVNQGETVHLEFEGQSQWDYDIRKTDQKNKSSVQLTVPALTEASQATLRAFTSPLVKSIEIDTKGTDGKFVLTFQLSRVDIEPFDYLTEKPSKLIVDFFKSSEKSVAEKSVPETEEKVVAKKAPTKVSEKIKGKTAAVKELPKKGESQRNPATADVLVVNDKGQQMSLNDVIQNPKGAVASGVFDGGDPDFSRFNIKDYEIKDDAIIGSKEKVYLEFPMLKVESPYLSLLQTQKPVYEVTPNDSDENKQMRLLLTLFQNKRHNVFLKSVDWFLKKYPESQYDEMVRFMWADALFALWLDKRNVDDFDLAMLRYRQALEKYPESALLERTMMLMGFATLDRGDYLGTLRLFQSHLDKRPNSPNKDIAKLAIADSYLKIKRFDEATQIYNELEKTASQEKFKIQGAYLRGDVSYQKKDFKGAIQEYQNALKQYPEGASEFPGAYYNQASAYFQAGDFRKALDNYREFLKRYPTHEESGYAMTRAGEILDILGADKERVLGTYLETYFRYGDTQSSVVARLRMLSERMNTMKPKEVEKAVKDIQELAKQSNLAKIDQFATLMIAEGYNSRKEYDKAVDLLVKYYQEFPNTADTHLLQNRIVKNINENLKDLVENGDFINALKLHNQYADNWLKSSHRLDTKFNVGRAFEQSGVFTQAEALYKDVLNQLYALKGTAAGKERNVFEKLPSEDELNLRLASVAMQANKMAPAYEYLRAIKSPEKMSETDQIERVEMASTLLDQKGETDSAIRYLSELLKVWAGRPELVADPYLHLAQLELKKGQTDGALASLQKIDSLMDDSKKVNKITHSKSLEMQGDLQLKKNNIPEAIAAYEKLLDLYEKDRPLASYRYKVGDLYFQKGEVKKAAQVWNDLKNEKSDFWFKLSQEQLKGSEWKDEYKKYIKRIPAMSSGPNDSKVERK